VQDIGEGQFAVLRFKPGSHLALDVASRPLRHWFPADDVVAGIGALPDVSASPMTDWH